jgi:serine/threonine protein kinase
VSSIVAPSSYCSDASFPQLNVLIDDECHIRLCDFGLVIVGDGTEGRMTTTARGVGSGTWQSPERFLGERHRRTMGDDVYAFGCLGYYVGTIRLEVQYNDPVSVDDRVSTFPRAQ